MKVRKTAKPKGRIDSFSAAFCLINRKTMICTYYRRILSKIFLISVSISSVKSANHDSPKAGHPA